MSLPATTFYTLLTEVLFYQKQFRKMSLPATTFYTLLIEAFFKQKQFRKMSLPATTFYTLLTESILPKTVPQNVFTSYHFLHLHLDVFPFYPKSLYLQKQCRIVSLVATIFYTSLNSLNYSWAPLEPPKLAIA